MKSVVVGLVGSSWSGVKARNAPLSEDGMDVLSSIKVIMWVVVVGAWNCENDSVHVE